VIAACAMRTAGGVRRLLAGWRRFAHDRSGAAILEFALAFPFLALLALGGFEIGRFVLLQEKLESLAVETADLVSQAQSLTNAQLNDIFQAARTASSS
jgi:Flp pilus assembly protein TadG